MNEFFSPEEQRELVIDKKAKMHFESDEPTPEQIKEAEKIVDEMIEQYGSIETVALVLDIELTVEKAGITEEYYNAEADSIEEAGDFNMEMIQKTIPIILKMIAEGKVEEADQMASELAEISIKFNEDVFLKHFANRPELLTNQKFIDILVQRREITRQILSNQYEKMFEMASAAAPDGGDLPPTRKTLQQELLLKTKTSITRAFLLTAAATGTPPPDGPPPPPSGGDDPKRIYETLTPAELEDVDLGNGLWLRFTPSFETEQLSGKLRKFNNASLVHEVDGRVIKEMNLSEQVPGADIVFEGNRNPSYRGCAYPEKVENKSLVSLNIDYLKSAGPVGLSTIFHEIGHHYLYGDQDKKLLTQEKNNIFKMISRFVTGEKSNEIAGLKRYQKAISAEEEKLKANTDYLREQLREFENEIDKNRLPIVKVEPIYTKIPPYFEGQQPITVVTGFETKYLKMLTDEEKLFVEKMNRAIADGEKLYKSLTDPLVIDQAGSGRGVAHVYRPTDLIMRIFHERNARAFAVKKMRKMIQEWPMGDLTGRNVLDNQISSLHNEANKNQDPRYLTGIK